MRKEHLTTFKQNDYPLPFIHAISSLKRSTTPPEELDEEKSQEEEKQPLAVIPYVSDMSEQIRKACEKLNLKFVFKSGTTSPIPSPSRRGLPG